MGVSGKLVEKQGLKFVKVKNHQTDQALHFYKVEPITFKLQDEIPKLRVPLFFAMFLGAGPLSCIYIHIATATATAILANWLKVQA